MTCHASLVEMSDYIALQNNSRAILRSSNWLKSNCDYHRFYYVTRLISTMIRPRDFLTLSTVIGKIPVSDYCVFDSV